MSRTVSTPQLQTTTEIAQRPRAFRPIGVTIDCPVCARTARLMARHAEADLYRCGSCDHCFSDPSSIGAFEAYSADYYETTHRNWFANPNYGLFRLISSDIVGGRPDASVLDVGCGRGSFLRWLREQQPALDLTGIDLSCVDGVQDGIRWRSGDFLQTPLDRQYDVVTTFATIEHVLDIDGFMKRLCDACRPGGRIVIMTLNDRSLLYGISRWLTRVHFRSAFERLYSKHHLHHFNRTSLRALAERHGLRVEKHLMHNAPLASIDFDARSTLPTPMLKLGVSGIFALSALTGQTYLQTLICER